MIDKRLIDYSEEYKEYESALDKDGKKLSLENMISLLEVFLFDETKDISDRRYDAVISKLKQAKNAYIDISQKCSVFYAD